jgi:hypothetical protein
MESTGILVLTSRPGDNVYLAPSICNAPVRVLESRSLSSGQIKSQNQKRTLVSWRAADRRANWFEDGATSVARLRDVGAVLGQQFAALRFTEPHENLLVVEM